jgi:hypothetical protein
VKVLSSFKRFKYVSLTILAMSCIPHATRAQDWIKTGTGLGLEKPRIAVADFAPRVDPAKSPHYSLRSSATISSSAAF